jgi:hypothetical protein
VSRESGRGTGSGRGATHASAGGSSAQQRSRDAAAAAARPCGKGPGDFAFDGVRAAAGRARKAARSDCASGATSAGVTLGGSGAAVRARLGGGTSAMTKAPEHEMGQCITRLAPGGGPDAPGQRTVVAACCGCCDGNELCAFGCGWQGVRLPLKWGPRCCGRAVGRSLTRVEDSSGQPARAPCDGSRDGSKNLAA